MAEKWKKRMNQISIKTQLAILLIAIFSVMIVSIIGYMYYKNQESIFQNHMHVTEQLLSLEQQNIDNYFAQIDHYSLLLRNNTSLMQMISRAGMPSYAEQELTKNVIKSAFHSRDDLIAYRIYPVNMPVFYEISRGRLSGRMGSLSEPVASLSGYAMSIQPPHFKWIRRAETPEAFVVYDRAIIQIQDQSPLAIVELVLDHSYMDSIAQNNQRAGALFCMVDEAGKLLYPDYVDGLDDEAIQASLNKIGRTASERSMTLQNKRYLITAVKSEKYAYTLLNLTPAAAMDQELRDTRNISVMIGLAAIVAATGFILFFVNLITKPLLMLAKRFRRVGLGKFKTTIHIDGCREIVHLSDNFNAMTQEIDDLIHKKYISELNEKTSRLIALEAQVNPHFLYNTLQAISTEAVVNDQMKIYDMVMALASMLRYSIKGSKFVPLSTEIQHVQDYLLLQQARFEDQLGYHMTIEPDAEALYIPKISIMTLVENSIIHGMKGDGSKLHIEIGVKLHAAQVFIYVFDNGQGFQAEKLADLQQQFQAKELPADLTNGIGLLNLYIRLRLLYGDRANLEIDSIPNENTVVMVTMPIEKEEPSTHV